MSKYPPEGPPPYYSQYPYPPAAPTYPHVQRPPAAPTYPYVQRPPAAPTYPYVQRPPAMGVAVYPPQTMPRPNPPNNTYVTNIVHQKPEQVQVVNNVSTLEWIPASAATVDDFHGRAVVAGYEGWDKSPLWVIRSRLNGHCVPGKLAAKHKAAFVPFGRKEVRVHDFEILVGPSHLYRWASSSNGAVPPGAFTAGNTAKGEPLYVSRCRYLKSLTPGKVHPSHGCCYISFGGGEISFKLYEVLCTNT